MGDGYRHSAAIYDLLYTGLGIKDYRREADEIDRLIRQRLPGARTLLDVACGTGQHLALLSSRYEVTGLDLSEAMLAEARLHAPGVELHLGDMRHFDLGRTFDAVICLFSAIGHMASADDLALAIANLARHTAPRGVLVIDGWVRPEAWRGGQVRPADVAADGERSVARMTHSARSGDVTTLEMHHLVHTRDGIRHFVESHSLLLVPTSTYLAELAGCGMEATVISDYMPGRDRLVAVRRADVSAPRSLS